MKIVWRIMSVGVTDMMMKFTGLSAFAASGLLVLALASCSAPPMEQAEMPPPSEAHMPDRSASEDGAYGADDMMDEGWDEGWGDEMAMEEPAPAMPMEEAVALEVVTDFLDPDEDFRPGPGELPQGIVLFSREQELKNAILCDAYIKDLRTFEEASAESPDADFFVTYWPLAAQPDSYQSCDSLRDAYDYDRADAIKAEYGLQDLAGPVFLAVDANGDSVFLDLSDSDLEATRSAVTHWLALALEASTPAEEEDFESDASAADMADVWDPPANDRFSLGGFTRNIKARLISADSEMSVLGSSGATETGIRLFAYTDLDTGYRVGSSIRF